MIGLDHFRACPHPVLVLVGGQCVEVDHHLPVRGVGAVAVQRGATPEAARIRRVAPEVVQPVAAAADVRNPRIGVEYLERLGAHLLEAFVAQRGKRRLVVAADPVQRVVAGDVLEPEVGVRGVCLLLAQALVGVHASHSDRLPVSSGDGPPEGRTREWVCIRGAP